MNLLNEFGDKLILDPDKSRLRIEYAHGAVSVGFTKHPTMKWMFVKDEYPGSNTNEEISLMSAGVVWSTGCGYSGTTSLYPIPENLRAEVAYYFT